MLNQNLFHCPYGYTYYQLKKETTQIECNLILVIKLLDNLEPIYS